MIFSYSVCLRDEAIACSTLEWMILLDGRLDYDCILTIGEGVVSEPIVEAATRLFRTVTVLRCDGPNTWPPGKNYAFQSLVRYLDEKGATGSFFWGEPDAIPLKKGWLATLEAEHIAGGKPFSGYVHEALNCMECVGFYPANFMEYSPTNGMLCRAAPWDRCAGPEIVPHAHSLNHLMQFVRDDARGFPPTFPKVSGFGFRVVGLKEGAVLFHRVKDNSLVEQLSGGKISRKAESRRSQSAATEREAFFQMGRFGDLILLLPAFKEWAERSGQPVVVFTSAHYGTVLEGVSYVEPVILPYHWYHEAGEALWVAQKRFPKVRRTQLYGYGLPPFRPDALASFSLSMWRETGLPLEDYYRMRPVFDRRAAEREGKMVSGLVGGSVSGSRPILLVSLMGETSPLECAPELLVMLQETFGDRAHIVETSGVQAERIYDLLGLMEVAAGLITIDTATLHLASASKVPTIHLIRDDGKAGSVPKGNVAGVFGYSNVRGAFEEMAEIVNGWVSREVAREAKV